MPRSSWRSCSAWVRSDSAFAPSFSDSILTGTPLGMTPFPDLATLFPAMGGWARWFQHVPPSDARLSVTDWLAMAQHAPFQMIFCRPDQTTEWVNHAFETMTGFSLADLTGKRPGDVLQCGQTDAQVRRRVREALASQQSTSEEILNRAKDGRLFWIHMDIEPVHDIQGELIGYLSQQTDITVQVEQRKRLWKAASSIAMTTSHVCWRCLSTSSQASGSTPCQGASSGLPTSGCPTTTTRCPPCFAQDSTSTTLCLATSSPRATKCG